MAKKKRLPKKVNPVARTAADAASEFSGNVADAALVEGARAPALRRRRGNAESAFKISTTAPDELRRHNISDEELEMLTRDNRDGLSEAFWGLVGAAAAALPSAGESLWDAFAAKTPVALNPLHLIEVMIVVGGIVGAIIIKIVSRGRSNRVTELVTSIRGRQAS